MASTRRWIVAVLGLSGCSEILGTASFSDLPSPTEAGALGDYAVDIDGDGKADYVAVDDDGGARAWINNGGDGHGGWTDYGKIFAGGVAAGRQIRLADIDGDGKADYLAVDEKGAVRAWINQGGDGHGGWDELGQVASGVSAPSSQIRFADLDGDKKADYLAMNETGALRGWINAAFENTQDHWVNRGSIASGVGVPGSNVRMADVDGDGRADYMEIQASGAVRAWINNGGDGNGQPGWIVPTSYFSKAMLVPPRQIRFADIDGDGKADLLGVDDKGAVRAWINKGAESGLEAYGQFFEGGVAPSSQIRL